MVKITNLIGDEKEVTKGAFESIFKPLGYKIVTNEKLNEMTGKKIDKADVKEAKIDEVKEEQKTDKEVKFDTKRK